MTNTASESFFAAISATISSMEDDVEYVFELKHWEELDKFQVENDYYTLDRDDHILIKRDGKLFIGGTEVKNENFSAFALAFTLAFTFTFTVDGALASIFALADGKIEKRYANSCEGKVVEIDGKNYRLKAV